MFFIGGSQTVPWNIFPGGLDYSGDSSDLNLVKYEW